MKKLGLLNLIIALLFSITSINAQSTYVQSGPHDYDAGIFSDQTSSSSLTGFTEIHAYNAGGTANTWSAPVALPFAFEFYGTPVTHFIVSKNFLLSFDTTLKETTVATALNTNSGLPSSDLPDNTLSLIHI